MLRLTQLLDLTERHMGEGFITTTGPAGGWFKYWYQFGGHRDYVQAWVCKAVDGFIIHEEGFVIFCEMLDPA